MSNSSHNDPSPSETSFASAGAQHDLYVAYAKRLRRIVGSQVRTSDANLEDACSYAWTQLVARRPSRDGSILAWLATVAIHQALRLSRLERRDLRDGDEVTLDALELPAASSVTADAMTVEEMTEVLRTIHPRKRRMLLLHAAGFTYQEIATEYGVSVERARALVYKARLQVRARSEGD